jgi:D-aspartate ligase
MAARPTPVIALMSWASALAVMRSLGPIGVPVYGIGHGALHPCRFSRYSAGSVDLGDGGDPLAEPGRVLERLLEAGGRLGDAPVLVAGTDEWARFVAANRAALSQVFRLPQLTDELAQTLASKAGQHEIAVANGVPTPWLVTPRDLRHAGELAGGLRYPVMVKPTHRVYHMEFKGVARGPEELLRHYRALSRDPDAPTVSVQEYVPGRDEDDWIFDGYFDDRSRCLAGFTARKLRQQPAHHGHCSLGETQPNPSVADTTVELLGRVGYRGPVDVHYRFDRRDGRYKLLDVNPRLGGAFRLFVDAAGVDVVRVMYWHLTGQPVPEIHPVQGRRWVREHEDVVAMRQYRRSDGLTAREWLRSLRTVDEWACVSLRDPLPFPVATGLVLWQTVAGRLRHDGATVPLRERP